MAVNITIDRDFKIQSDRLQWVLVWNDRNIGFFEDLESLIKCYFKQKIRLSDAKTISGLLEVHKQCLSKCQHLLAPLSVRVSGVNSNKRPSEVNK